MNVPEGTGGIDGRGDEEVGRMVGPGKGGEWRDLI